MTRKAKKTKPATTPPRRSRRLWHIIVIDQEPLRRIASADCRNALARLEKVRAEWHRFEHQDKPAFARWMAQEFGPLLSAAREVEAQVREKEMLIQEVETEMRFGARSRRAAYERVMYERAHPPAERDDDDPDVPGDKPFDPKDFSDFEKEALFQDWLEEFLGVNPDKMDDRSYWKSFESFKFHIFGEPGERTTNSARQLSAPFDVPERTAGSRLKDLYRLLVRRLHPDLRADGEAAVSSLWHEVQESYAEGNIERLETLLALSDIESNNLGPQTTLFQMRAVLKELKTALRSLQRSLRAARDDDAWDFVRCGATVALRLRIQRQLEIQLVAQRDKLITLHNIIAGWSRPSRVTGRRKAPPIHPGFAF